VKRVMTHDELREALAAAALDALSPGEQEEVIAHAADCPECREELRGWYETAAALAHLAPVRPMDPSRSARVRARLVARAAADREPAAAPAPESVRPGRRSVWASPAAGWLTAAGLAGLLLTHHVFHHPLNIGWEVAWGFGMALLAVGTYGWRQRRRADGLGERLRAAERELERLR